MRERRRFYRIDDNVVFKFRRFEEAEYETVIARIRSNGAAFLEVQSSLSLIEARLELVLADISTPLPEIGEALRLMNRKLNLLSNVRHMQDGDQHPEFEDVIPTHEINLSASGLAFRAGEMHQIGEMLEIDLLLFPDFHAVTAVGRVVGCREVESREPEERYLIAVDFDYVSQSDREQIIHHVLNRQSRELKAKREMREAMSAEVG